MKHRDKTTRLYVDTVTNTFYCLLVQGGVCKRFQGANSVEVCNKNLFNFLKQNDISCSSIGHLYFTIGPGSYTGVRIGGIIAKTWNNLFPTCILHTIESLSLQVNESNAISVVSIGRKKKVIAVFENYKIIYKTMVNNYNENIEHIQTQFPNKKLIVDYQNVDLFECFQLKSQIYKLATSSKSLNLIYDIDENY